MTEGRITTLECDGCDTRVLVTDGTKEGKPKGSHISNGWVVFRHRDPEDHLAIRTSHFCPECVVDRLPSHVPGGEP